MLHHCHDSFTQLLYLEPKFLILDLLESQLVVQLLVLILEFSNFAIKIDALLKLFFCGGLKSIDLGEQVGHFFLEHLNHCLAYPFLVNQLPFKVLPLLGLLDWPGCLKAHVNRAAEHTVLNAFLGHFTRHRLAALFKAYSSVADVLSVSRLDELVLFLKKLERKEGPLAKLGNLFIDEQLHVVVSLVFEILLQLGNPMVQLRNRLFSLCNFSGEEFAFVSEFSLQGDLADEHLMHRLNNKLAKLCDVVDEHIIR